mgnify:CR=1 FL=1
MTSQDAPLNQKKRERMHKDRVESTKTLVKNKQEAAEWMKDSLPFPETKTLYLSSIFFAIQKSIFFVYSIFFTLFIYFKFLIILTNLDLPPSSIL